MSLSRNDILSVDDRRYVMHPVPAWGGEIRLQSLSAGEAVEYAKANIETPHTAVLRIVYMCAVDESGERLFKEEDLAVLQKKDSQTIADIGNRALIHNGFRKGKVEPGKSADVPDPVAAVKND